MGWGNALFDLDTDTGLGATQELIEQGAKWYEDMDNADDSGSSVSRSKDGLVRIESQKVHI